MLQETVDRLRDAFDAASIYVTTNAAYADLVRASLPEIPVDNIILEPAARETANGIGLACAVVAARHPGAIVATFNSDHAITNPDVLLRGTAVAMDFVADEANADMVVTFGIRPRYPETGYGYIRRGAVLVPAGEYTIFAVDQFVEKPDLARAKQYLDAGIYEWNAGMFVFRAAAMLEKFARHLPDNYAGLARIGAAVGTPAYDAVLTEVFPTLPKVSVDYGILEKDDRVAVLPLALSWSDVGSWAALRDLVASHTRENISRGELITHNSEGLYVRSAKPVVAIGVEDLVIVETDDAILVCDRDHAQDVSRVVKDLEAAGRAELL